MTAALPKFKAAAIHVAPVFMDTQATVDKACALIAEAAANGARLIAFPETYIPAFPIWAAVRAPIEAPAPIDTKAPMRASAATLASG